MSVFEVKQRVRKGAAIGMAVLGIFFLGIWIYFLTIRPKDVCTSSFLFLLSIFFFLISGGLMIPNSVRISDESIMFLRGSTIDSEVRLDDIEKVELTTTGMGGARMEIYANGERKMIIEDVALGSDRLEAVVEELKRLSEKHHFPVIEKESRLEEMKEESLERRDEAIRDMEAAYGNLFKTSDEDLPYRVK